MKQLTKDLAAVPELISGLAAGHDEVRLTRRADEKTWSASDVLAHLRSAAEVRGKWIAAMLDRDHPTVRAVSPRSAFRKYVNREFAVSLKEFADERAALVKRLRGLDEAGWTRGLTFTAPSPRSAELTVACALRTCCGTSLCTSSRSEPYSPEASSKDRREIANAFAACRWRASATGRSPRHRRRRQQRRC